MISRICTMINDVIVFQGSVECVLFLHFSRGNMCSHAWNSWGSSAGSYQGQVTNSVPSWGIFYFTKISNDLEISIFNVLAKRGGGGVISCILKWKQTVVAGL